MPTHADVPEQLAFDDDKIGFGIEPRPHRADDFLDDAALDLLAFAIVGIESSGPCGMASARLARQQQMQRFLGGFQPAGGVEARRRVESRLRRCRGRAAVWATCFSATRPGRCVVFSRSRPAETRMRFSPRQRNEVGDGAERHQVEQRAQIEIRGAGQTGFAPALDQRVGEFEGQAGGAELGEQSGRVRVSRSGSGVSGLPDCGFTSATAGGAGDGDLVMIQHDDIDAALFEPGDGFHGGRTAIHRQQQRGREFLQAILHAVPAEAVTFVHAMGQIVAGVPAEPAEDFEQQRGGSDAVHVVIAEDDQRFVRVRGPGRGDRRRRPCSAAGTGRRDV